MVATAWPACLWTSCESCKSSFAISNHVAPPAGSEDSSKPGPTTKKAQAVAELAKARVQCLAVGEPKLLTRQKLLEGGSIRTAGAGQPKTWFLVH